MNVRQLSLASVASTVAAIAALTCAAPQHDAPAKPATPPASAPKPETPPPAKPDVKPDAKPEVKPDAKPAAPVATADLPEASKVIGKHIDAIGGREKLDGFTSSSYKGGATLPGVGQVTLEYSAKKPNLVFIKQSMGTSGEAITASDGKIAWATTPVGEPRLLEDEMMAQVTEGTDIQGLVRNLDTRFASTTTTGKKDLDGVECWVLTLQDKDGPPMTAYFDAKTGLIIASERTEQGPQGPITQVQRFSDWEDVDGIKVFKTMTNEVMGMKMVFTFSDFQFNKVPDSVFTPPDAIKQQAEERAKARAEKVAEPPKPDAPKTDAPKGDAPKSDGPKQPSAPKAEPPKAPVTK